jgi:hypothetical protein
LKDELICESRMLAVAQGMIFFSSITDTRC